MTAAASRLAALAGLVALAAMLAVPLGPGTVIAVVPIAAVLVAGAAAARRWAIATAIVMLPYFSYGVMEVLTNPGGRTRALLLTTLTIAVFFAALDSMRRR